MTVPEPVWDRALALVREADEVVLTCHVHPDGDALGSVLGLGLALRRAGRRVCAAYDGQAPAVYRMLPGRDLLVPAAALPSPPGLVVTLDCGSLDRLGELAAVAKDAEHVLVLDHHASSEGFGDVRVVDPGAAATAVLVEELLRRLGLPLDRDVAACLYTALTTDTGSFKHPSTTPAVHAMAGRLLATGIHHDEISRAIWDSNPFRYLHVLGAALSRTRLEPAAAGGHGLAWTWVEAGELARAGLTLAEMEGVIDVVRTTVEADVAVVCKQDADGSWKVSVRSKGRHDVGSACHRLGGGGHRFAAGFTSHEGPEPTLARLRAELDGTPADHGR